MILAPATRRSPTSPVFPFDTIKIDKSFVDDTSPKKTVLLRSMVNMAHDLGLAVVAEGVPNESEALELRQMGCEYVQSFAFGAPMGADMAIKVLKSSSSQLRLETRSRQAWPATVLRRDRSIPIEVRTRSYLVSMSVSNKRSNWAGHVSQSFSDTSRSSCPGLQPE
jgi:hypothetical protein